MGAWPDWWPANPVGSWWDERQKEGAAWMLVLYLVLALGIGLLAIYIWRRIE